MDEIINTTLAILIGVVLSLRWIYLRDKEGD